MYEYTKIVFFMCVAGISSASNLLATTPYVYSAPSSSVSYSAQTIVDPGTVTYTGAPVATYGAPVASYSYGPIASSVSYQAVSKGETSPVYGYALPALSYGASPIISPAYPSLYAARPVLTPRSIITPAAYSPVIGATPFIYGSKYVL